MEIQRKRLSKEEFDRGRTPSASFLVAVEVEIAEDRTTAGGIVIGFNEETQYAEGQRNHIADVAVVHGVVRKVPANLNFNPKNPNCPPWETKMELEIGDEVWFSPLISTNCTELLVEDKVYKLIPYGDLFVAKRNGVAICLNGYCIVEKVNKESLGSLDLLSGNEIDITRGVIRYCGTPNVRYENKIYSDDIDVKPGDMVVFTKGNYPIPLEVFEYNACFDGDKMYYATQRRFMAMVLSENN